MRIRQGLTDRLPAIALAAGLFLLLIAFAAADPARGFTFSRSPWSDEGYNAIGARNLVMFGRASSDDFNLWLVNLPFTAALSGAFALLGVGIVQARLVTILATSLTAYALARGLERPFGRSGALVAAAAFATSILTLYYGRLVYLEDLQALALVLGTLTLVDLERRRPALLGLGAGIAFAVAIGTKPSAVFSVVGILLFVGLAGARSSARVRVWLGVAAATVAVAGLAWVLLVALPNLDALRHDFAIWPPYVWPRGLRSFVLVLEKYFTTEGDQGGLFLAPLLLGAGAGLAATIERRRLLEPEQRRLVVAAAGWFAVSMAVLLVVSYRPNRYLVPLVPALAILIAPGAATICRRLGPRLPAGRVAVPVALAGLLAIQGVTSYASWMRSARYDLPSIQDEMRRAAGAGGAAVGHDAPTLLLTAPGRLLVPWGEPATVNGGDLYADPGARLYLVDEAGPPGRIARDHPEAWAAREQLACGHWGGSVFCLYRLP